MNQIMNNTIDQTRTKRDSQTYLEKLKSENLQLLDQIQQIEKQIQTINYGINKIQYKKNDALDLHDTSRKRRSSNMDINQMKNQITQLEKEVQQLIQERQIAKQELLKINEDIEILEEKRYSIYNNLNIVTQITEEIDSIRKKISIQEANFDYSLSNLKIIQKEGTEIEQSYKDKIQEEINQISKEREQFSIKNSALQQERNNIQEIVKKWNKKDLSSFKPMSKISITDLLFSISHPDPKVLEEISQLHQQLDELRLENKFKQQKINEISQSLNLL